MTIFVNKTKRVMAFARFFTIKTVQLKKSITVLNDNLNNLIQSARSASQEKKTDLYTSHLNYLKLCMYKLNKLEKLLFEIEQMNMLKSYGSYSSSMSKVFMERGHQIHFSIFGYSLHQIERKYDRILSNLDTYSSYNQNSSIEVNEDMLSKIDEKELITNLDLESLIHGKPQFNNKKSRSIDKNKSANTEEENSELSEINELLSNDEENLTPSMKYSQMETEDIKKSSKYNYPTLDILKTFENPASQENHDLRISQIKNTLQEFDIYIDDIDFVEGPSYSIYFFKLPNGIGVKAIQSKENELLMRTQAENLRVIAPIKGENLVGIEVSKEIRDLVFLKECLKDSKTDENIQVPIGKDIYNKTVFMKIFANPHSLAAGETGSGKSVHLNALLASVLFSYSPEDVRVMIIDPKRVEFNRFTGIPHLLVKKPIFEEEHIVNALDYLLDEMEERYTMFEQTGCRNITEYNNGQSKKIPRILVIIDEVSDILTGSNKSTVEEKIIRLGRLARAAGISIYLATQRPSVDVVNARIKANFPVRAAFKVANRHDSTTIINESGADKLIGKGDMLLLDRDGKIKHCQGVFFPDENLDLLIKYIKENNHSVFNKKIDDLIFSKD